LNKGSKILFGIIGVVATGGLLLLLKDNKKTEPSLSISSFNFWLICPKSGANLKVLPTQFPPIHVIPS
jgi:hypothetical protein